MTVFDYHSQSGGRASSENPGKQKKEETSGKWLRRFLVVNGNL
jgi:hypothetical protein